MKYLEREPEIKATHDVEDAAWRENLGKNKEVVGG